MVSSVEDLRDTILVRNRQIKLGMELLIHSYILLFFHAVDLY